MKHPNTLLRYCCGCKSYVHWPMKAAGKYYCDPCYKIYLMDGLGDLISFVKVNSDKDEE